MVSTAGIIVSAGIIGGLTWLNATSNASHALPKADLDSLWAATPHSFQIDDSRLESDLLARSFAHRMTVQKKDTLMSMLTEAGVKRTEAHQAITALSKKFNPRDLRIGQDITLTILPEANGYALDSLELEIDFKKSVRVQKDGNGIFGAEIAQQQLDKSPVRLGGTIQSSLFLAGRRERVPPSTLAALTQIFSFDVDFQRDIQPGDSFDVMFETFQDESAKIVGTGNILVAEMVLSGKKIRLYRFKANDGIVDYFNEKGQSIRKALILTPIDGARISSGYGRRKHPILGYTKMHRGIDFAAARGTPIYAAGHGTVEFAGRNGGYGNYVRIRHNGTYKTAYAHMHRFGRGVRRGARVRQGQIIGYVGSTGRSTGPHLHYEIHKNGRQINPKRLNLPSGRQLQGAELAAFNNVRDQLEQRYAALPAKTQMAASEETAD